MAHYPRPWNPPPGAIIFAALPRDGEGRRIWQCTRCATKGPWTPGWVGYGSMMDEDDGFFQAVFCSDACRKTLEPYMKPLLDEE
jgi:hypothetical protein